MANWTWGGGTADVGSGDSWVPGTPNSWIGGDGPAPVALGRINSQGYSGILYKLPDGYYVNGKKLAIDDATAQAWLSGAAEASRQAASSSNFGTMIDDFAEGLGPLLPLAVLGGAAAFGGLGGVAGAGAAGAESAASLGAWEAGMSGGAGAMGMGSAAGMDGAAVLAGMNGAGAATGAAGVGLDLSGGEGFWEMGNGAGGMSGGATGGSMAGGGTGLGFYGGGLTNTAGSALSTLGSIAQGAGAAGALSKVLSGNASLQDWLSLLDPAMSVMSGIEGYGRASDMTDLVSGDVNSVLAGLGNTSISPTATPTDRSAASAASIAGADPWSASGGRALADQQLQDLMRDPSGLMNDPGYKAKTMAVDRLMAQQGQLGGGGGAVAAANASGDYYDQRLRTLAALESMGNPVGAQQLGLEQSKLGLLQDSQQLEREKAAANLATTQSQIGLDAAKLKLAAAGNANAQAGQSLASIGYGVTQATGGGTTDVQRLVAALRQAGAI